MTESERPARGGRECPVCGSKTYSAAGIHPQCAATQRDQERKKELVQKKSEAPAKDPKAAANKRWNKRCPGCKTEVHVRLKKCACGHTFSTS